MHFLRPQDLHQGIQKGSALLHWNKKHGFVCRDIVFGCCRKVRLKARKTRLLDGATTESLLRSFVVFLFVFLFDIFFDIWGGVVSLNSICSLISACLFGLPWLHYASNATQTHLFCAVRFRGNDTRTIHIV